jgi:hypothetical protein
MLYGISFFFSLTGYTKSDGTIGNGGVGDILNIVPSSVVVSLCQFPAGRTTFFSSHTRGAYDETTLVIEHGD